MSFRHVIRKVVRNPPKFHYQVPFPGKKFWYFRDSERIYYIWAVYAVGILIIITALVYYFTAKWYFHIRGGKLEPHEIPENFDFTQVGFQSDVLSNWCWWLNCYLSPKWIHVMNFMMIIAQTFIRNFVDSTLYNLPARKDSWRPRNFLRTNQIILNSWFED